MCPRRSSSWPAASQQRSVPQNVLHPLPPRPALGLRREAAAEELGPCRWKWPSVAPVVPDIGAHGVPYPELQRDKNDPVLDAQKIEEEKEVFFFLNILEL